MKANSDKVLRFFARERELCELAETTLRDLVTHYDEIRPFRSARYYIQSEATTVLVAAEGKAIAMDQQARLSHLECLILASCFQDTRIIAEQFGDASTSDYAHVHEQRWLAKSDFRGRRFLSLVVRGFWGATSSYGTDAWKLLGTVIAVVLVFAVLYTPTPTWLVEWFPSVPRLQLHDDSAGTSGMHFLDALYFSLVTITTVGYGDVKPVNTLARLVVPLEAVFGVCLFGVFVTVVTRCVPARVMGSPLLDQLKRNDGEVMEKKEEDVK